MQKYVKIYLEYFNYGEQDYIPSELSGSPATDIHHIIPKSQGGKDEIENLIGLTREEHDQAHGKRLPKLEEDYLREKHLEFINKL
jgi:5-methylcytosine-specific restriction endonuclease McrA